jgi:hypothetical protein
VAEAHRLFDIYSKLDQPAQGGLVFSALRVPEHKYVRVARSAAGPAVLFEVQGTSQVRAPIELRNLQVLFAAQCRVVENSHTTEGQFTAVVCRATSQDLQELFFDAIASILPALETPSEDQIDGIVKALVELFRAIGSPRRTSLQGIWGELLLVARSNQPDGVIKAWHALPSDRYDFARGNERVEVKAALGERRHHFSLDQLRPGPELVVYVVSMLVESSAAGWSIAELVGHIASRCVDKSLGVSVATSVATVLGEDAAYWATARYDAQTALNSLLFFPTDSIPRVDDPPTRVSDVRFVVDLTGLDDKAVDPLKGGSLAKELATGSL